MEYGQINIKKYPAVQGSTGLAYIAISFLFTFEWSNAKKKLAHLKLVKTFGGKTSKEKRKVFSELQEVMQATFLAFLYEPLGTQGTLAYNYTARVISWLFYSRDIQRKLGTLTFQRVFTSYCSFVQKSLFFSKYINES